MAKPSFASGFTLVELIVTLVIIGALAAASAPVFFTTSTFEARGFFDEVVAATRYAQKHAVASGCTVQVQYTTNSVILTRGAGIAACTAGPFGTPVIDPSNLGDPLGFRRIAPAGVAVAPLTTLTFNPLGAASVGVTITVGSRSFQIEQATGYVH